MVGLVENVGIEPLLLCPRQACNRYTAFSIIRTDGLNFTQSALLVFPSRQKYKKGGLRNEQSEMVGLVGLEPTTGRL